MFKTSTSCITKLLLISTVSKVAQINLQGIISEFEDQLASARDEIAKLHNKVEFLQQELQKVEDEVSAAFGCLFMQDVTFTVKGGS